MRTFLELAGDSDGIARVERISGDAWGVAIWRDGADAPLQVYLENLFLEARDMDPDARARHLARALRVLTAEEETPSWDEARERLLPVVRDARMAMSPPYSEMNMVVEPFVPGLALYVVIDFDDRMEFVNEKHLTEWKVSAEAVIDLARSTLARAEHDVDRYRGERDPIWHLSNDDTYESSRLLLPTWRAAVCKQVGKPLAFAIPERATLLFAPADEPEALDALLEVAVREFRDAARPLSPDLYVEDDSGDLVPLEPSADHPLAATLRQVRRDFAAAT